MNLPNSLLPDFWSDVSWHGALTAALNSPFAEKLGAALLHFVWQGAIIGCVTALLLALLRNARPQTRYALACASLGLCLALPMAHLLLPGNIADALVTLPLQADSAALPETRSTANGMADGNEQPALWQPLPWHTLSNLAPAMVALWLAGMLIFSLRLLAGLLWLRRLHQTGSGKATRHSELQPIQERWQQTIDRLAQGFGLTRAVRLVFVNQLDSPVASGWWRPVVLVPAALISGLPPAYLEALLAHELAHIKRLDPLINLLQNTIETILFYHPAVWWISKQIRQEREQIADDLAATRLGDTRRLALALQQLDQFQSSINQFAPAANGGMLMTRIKRLIRPETRNLNWKVSLPLAGLALVCSTLYANVPVDQPKAVQSVALVPAAAPAATAPVLVLAQAPTAPAAPAPSAERVQRAKPATPAAPSTPRVTAHPGKAAPLAPIAPLAPLAPAAPLAQVASAEPLAPTAPLAPAAPPAPPAPPAPLAAETILTPAQTEAIKQFEARVEQLGANMGVIGAKQGEIGAEMGKIGLELAKGKTEAERAELREKMAQLRAKMIPLQQEMEQARKVMQAEMQQLRTNLGPLKEQIRAMQREAQREVQKHVGPAREHARQMAQLARERAQEQREVAREAAREAREAAREEREAARERAEALEKSTASGSAKPL